MQNLLEIQCHCVTSKTYKYDNSKQTMSYRSDTSNTNNLSSGVLFTDNEVCKGNEYISMNNSVSNDSSLVNYTHTNLQEKTNICNSANDQYNVSTVYGSINCGYR